MPAVIYSKAGSATATIGATTRGNRCINPQLGTGSTGWTQTYGTGGAGTSARAASHPSRPWWWQITWTTAPTAAGASVIALDTANASMQVVPGRTYTASLDGFVNWAGGDTNIFLRWLTAAGAVISTDVGVASAHPSGTVQRRWVTAVAPATAAFARVDFVEVGTTRPAIGSKMAATAVLFEESAVATSYFDGATPDLLYPPGPTARDYAWLGVAHASTSLERALVYPDVYEAIPLLAPVRTASSRSRNRVHWIINRSDPDVSFATAGLRTGELEMFFGTDEAAASVAEQMFRVGTTFRLVYPERPEWEMTFTLDQDGEIVRELDRSTANHWTLRVQYQEIDEGSY